MDGIGWTDLLSAVVGAAAAGGFGIWDRFSQAKRKREALRSALRAHGAFLTKLVREQKYEVDASFVVQASRSLGWDGGLLTIEIPSHYLDGIKQCLAHVGELKPEEASIAVEFCHRAQIFIDSTRPEMSFHSTANLEAKRSHAEETLRNISAFLEAGDRLVRL